MITAPPTVPTNGSPTTPSGESSGHAGAGAPRSWLAGPLGVLCAGAAMVLLGAAWFYRAELRRGEEGIEQNLRAIADLKVQQVEYWRGERLADASLIRNTPYAARRALDALAKPEDARTRVMFTGWLDGLMAGRWYTRALLLNEHLQLRLAYPRTNVPPPCSTLLRAAEQALATREVVVADLYRAAPGQAVHLGLVVPLVVRREGDRDNVPAAGLPPQETDRSAGVLILEANAEKDLFPVLDTLPTPYRTMEALLFRREGDEALLLKSPRATPGAAMSQRLTLAQAGAPVVRALNRQEGFMRGPNHCGTEVFSFIRPVPDSPWWLAVEVEAAEVLSRSRSYATLVLVAALLTVGLGVAMVFVWWQRHEKRHYRALYEASEALQESTALLRIAGRMARFGGWVVDLAQQRVTWSDEVANIHETRLGYSPTVAEAINFYAPEWRGKITQVLEACARNGTPYDEEMEILTARGHRIWVRTIGEAVRDRSGRITHVQGAFQDITDRKRAEQRLHESEERYRTLFEANPHCMWVYDLETLRFLAVNDMAIHRYGYTREEFLAMTIKDIRPPEEVTRLLENVATSTEVVQNSGLWRHRKKNGEIILVEILSHALSWAGRPARVVLAHDVTAREAAREALEASRRALLSVVEDQKAAELQVRRLNEELEQRVRERTQQLEAANKELESFSYSVSHDLRAPLRHVCGYVDLLRNEIEPALGENARRFLDIITHSAVEMGNLIDDLLDFARLGRQALRPVRINMDEFVREAVGVAEREAGGREITWRIEALGEVEADRDLLRLVLANLLSNAIKYTRSRRPAVVEIGCHPNGRETVFFVRDNGVGFDMRYADRLFGVFQRLHSAAEFEGNGIGLANVRRIINRHGGRTWAEGEVGRGATFYFSLPRSLEAA